MATTPHPRHRRSARLATVLLAGLVLAGCGSGFDDSAGDAAWMDDRAASEEAGYDPAAAPEMEGVYDEEDAMAGDDAMASDGSVTSPSPGADAATRTGRAVIRTASMHIRARDTAEVAEEVVVIAETAGGYVAGTDLTRDAEGVVSGSFTFRVPTGALTPTLDAFDELADAVLERRLDEVDVTNQLTDLDAELENLEAYEAQLREVLAEVRGTGEDTEALLLVFEQINQVRSRIDQVNAHRTVLVDQVALSTIYLRLSPTASTGPVTDPGWAPAETAREALTTTMRALTSLADAVIRIGLTILPLVLIVASPLLVVAWFLHRRWRRRQRENAAASEVPPSGTQDPGTPAPATQDPGTQAPQPQVDATSTPPPTPSSD